VPAGSLIMKTSQGMQLKSLHDQGRTGGGTIAVP
jgi:hypothetical protein